jgi:hypothetical protein
MSSLDGMDLDPRMQIKKYFCVLTDLTLSLDPLLFTTSDGTALGLTTDLANKKFIVVIRCT